MTHYKLGELFCGPGGIALGAKLASEEYVNAGGLSSVSHSWALDYDSDTTATYARNIVGENSSSVFTADVRSFDLSQTPGMNAFAYGFPCNDFSMVGERKGVEGEFGPLYIYGVHALALFEPDWFLAENVTGLSGANDGAAFGKILHDLQRPSSASLADESFRRMYSERLEDLNEDLNYELVAHTYEFDQYGVPQNRHRILIVGIRSDIASQLPRKFLPPAPTTLGNPITAKEALEIPPLPGDAPNHEFAKHHPRVIERLKFIKPGGNAFDTDFSERPDLKLNVKNMTLSNVYRRLSPDKPSYTVTGSGGGGTHVYHYEDLRSLTNRERARLQSFPDNYVFEGGVSSVRKQVGMAVPPVGVKHVIEAILKTLDGLPYPYTDPNLSARDLIAGHWNRENGRLF